jgi:hypothetical protein
MRAEATSPWEPAVLWEDSMSQNFSYDAILVIISMLLWKRNWHHFTFEGNDCQHKDVATDMKWLQGIHNIYFCNISFIKNIRKYVPWKCCFWISQWLIVSSTVTGKVKQKKNLFLKPCSGFQLWVAKNIVLCARSIIIELKTDCIDQNGFSFVQEVIIQSHRYLSMLAGCLLVPK